MKVTIRLPTILAAAALSGNREALAECRRQAAEQLRSEVQRSRKPTAELAEDAERKRMPTNRTKGGRRARRKLAARYMGHR